MDQIEKFVKKLDKKLARKIAIALEDIVIWNLKKYDVKKLQNYNDLYRIRISKVRIIFRKLKNNGMPLYIEYRGQAYKNL